MCGIVMLACWNEGQINAAGLLGEQQAGILYSADARPSQLSGASPFGVISTEKKDTGAKKHGTAS